MTRIPRGAAQFKWRRQRQQKARRWPTLNLVALMDVFTILVFFFLAHSVDGGTEAANQLVVLPESIAQQEPRETLIVMITPDTILLQGEVIVAVDQIEVVADSIDPLHAALQAQLSDDAAVDGAREVTIMGDRSVPFEVLNRVMQACKLAGYDNISLAVIQRVPGAG
ncbi:MAG: biopolymer transporter ExbD [Gammaproteobacteria bacterium]|nr:MAG: biopolymer transporter ExbD [Gammaproteobacteria bacterium]